MRAIYTACRAVVETLITNNRSITSKIEEVVEFLENMKEKLKKSKEKIV